MKYYLYNSLANNGIKPEMAPGTELVDAVGLNYPEYLNGLSPEDEVVLVGGDGTVNYFINAVKGTDIKNNIYLWGNGKLKARITADAQEKSPQEKIDYSGIAIKGLLFHFKPCHAEITVDGVKHEFDHVWIAPTMKGKYYGGGMKMAPDQDRFSDKLTVVVYHCRSKLKALIAFPSIFKGEHVNKTGIVDIFTGNEIMVRFSRPCAAQIDGETVLNVSEYTAVLPK